MRIFQRSLCLLICALLLTIVSVAQQGTGQISGIVKDSNGATIPNATIKLKNLGTNLEKTAVTNGDGFYLIPDIQPGSYQVSANAQGFKEAKQDIQVTVGSKLTVNLEAGVQNVNAEVTITEGSGLAEINTSDSKISNVISGKQIQNLPSLNRNPYALIALSGNISASDDPAGRGAGVSVNGQRAAGTSILIEGNENSDTFTTAVAQTPPLDAVQEFRVATNSFGAEEGRATGGIVNLAFRSGTNQFTGTVYAFNRNSALAANSFNNNANRTPRANFNRNQFGYAVGGPIVKDKLFFFNSTEWTTVRSSAAVFAWVPTNAFLTAGTTAQATKDFFAKYGKLVATPTGEVSGIFQKVVYNAPVNAGGGVPQDTWTDVTKINFNATDKTQFTGHAFYTSQKFAKGAGAGANSPYEGFDIGGTVFSHNYQFSMSHQFASNWISNSRIGFRRTVTTTELTKDAATPTLYMQGIAATLPDGNPIALPGYLPTFPGAGLPTSGNENLLQFTQDVIYTRGNHNFRMGGQYIRIMDNKTFPAFQNASLTLGANFAAAVANLQAGLLNQIQVAVDPKGAFPGGTINLPVSAPNFSRNNRYNEGALYFNDAWRIKSGINLNLGIRYEYYGPQHSNPDLDSNFYFGTGSTIQERIRNGSVKKASEKGGLWQADKNNFAPRLGFAWDIFGDGKTSLRGGYSLAYERNFGNVTFNVIQNPPFYAVVSQFATGANPIPIPANNFGPLAGNSGSVPLPVSSVRHVREDIVNAYSHLWSASFEREIMKDSVVKFDYSGSAGRKLYSLENLNRTGTGSRFLNSNNASVCPAGFVANTRLNCQYSNINSRSNSGYSDFNSVTASFESNNFRNKGAYITARYTYSVAKDNLSTTFSESANNFNLGLTDPFNPSYDYGYADFDARHRFISSFVWNLPTERYLSSGAIKNILGGWTLNGILLMASGSPFTIFDCTNATATTCIRMKPNGNINFGKPANLTDAGAPNSFIWTNLAGQTPSTFTDISGGTEVGPFPTDVAARNAFRGPGYWNFDMGLFKSIKFTERYNLQLRLELINAFNHSIYVINGPTADLSSNAFVSVSKQGSGGTRVTPSNRTIQLSAKFNF
ncbi:MAG: TonB-dependent receptor [Pyrinomonadaceae bacterium]|nr:TonB-dependent receptor [Pyrinomonadaceae bacterium]